ncbi:titin-like [Sinocyclocheilus grahami]|uniref:titin-like n=1 Tax=Sinocyclocheilus grahami TaxID=75366 RepID=UPI0007AD0BF6|nr:PREDICTED: titin-like [Sinocyclocheilus grahami]
MERFKIFLWTVAVSLQVTSQDSTGEPPIQISKPNIILNASHAVLYSTETVTLHCEVPDEPPGLQYDWYKDSADLSEHQPNITPRGSGKYECKAKKGASESEKSTSYTLTLKEPPEPEIRSDWTEAFPGEKVSLQCVIQGVSENWNYMWFKDSRKIVSSGETNIQGNTLTLSVKSSHDGAYMCQAELQGRKVTTAKSKPHLLKFKELPQPKLSIDSQWNMFYPTERVTLTCSVDEESNDWGYEWFKNRSLLKEDEDISFSGNTLSISSAKADHSGQYLCRGKHLTRTSVTTRETEAVQLHIQDITPKPTITRHEWFEFFYTEERVQLKCNMPGVGWEYHWYKDSNLQITNPEFTIDAVSLDDSGYYLCKAQRGDFSVDSEMLQVQVQKPPEPQIRSDWTEAFLWEKVSLQCVIQGVSENWNYMWFKDSSKILSSGETNIQGNTLTLSVKSSHDRAYMCQAELQGRKVTTAKSKPHLLTVKELPQPKLSIDSQWNMFYPTERVTLTCSVDEESNDWGYEWFKNRSLLKEDEDISFSGNTLSISSAKADHSGQYLCRGKHLTRTSVTTRETEAVQLHIQDITPKPTITRHEWFEFFYTEERVQLKCNMPGVGWEYHWYKDSNLQITNPEFTIDAVSLDDSGYYLCKAQRGDFSVDSEMLQVQVQKPPEPQIRSNWTEAFPGEKVSLQCVIQGVSEKRNYMWFKDSSKIVSSGIIPKPTITKHEWFELFYTDEKLQLDCNMPGESWEYQWHKDSNPLITSPTHTIDALSLTDSGNYHCKAQRGDFSVDSETLQVQVQARPHALLSLETELSDIMTGDMTLRCNVSDGRQWNYTWYMNGQQLNGSLDVLKVAGNEETIKSEFKCKGINTVRPLYSALSDGFIANNILFKRKILLAISGCLVCCIVILIIGCIVLKITRKPEVKETAPEDLFFSMTDSKNQTISPMKEYMDNIPTELEECQEKAELISDCASAVHEDGGIKDEDTPASEANGLTSFKGL